MQQPQRTEIGSLGEFGLIRKLSTGITLQHSNILKGIGDDAAVTDVGNGLCMLSSTDILAEGIHFDLSYCPLKHLGYKAIAVNVSDIAAMNGIPHQVTVSIALSNRFSVEAVEELYAGIRAACAQYKVDLVGGDTTASPAGLFISIGVIGFCESHKVVYRNTAKVNDLICVTGDLGGAYLGLNLLQREKQVYMSNPEIQPELEGRDYVLQRQLKPEARTDMVHQFADQQIHPSAMIDISDGLASELYHICTQSNVGARIYEDKLPIAEESLQALAELKFSSTACVLNGGEDYELLFTLPQSQFDLVKNHPDVTIIGYISPPEEGLYLITTNDRLVPIEAQGWVHFNASNG